MLLPPPHLQVKGAEKVLFGLDDIVGMSDIVVVEGEMDKLALEEAGYTNVVSVRAPACWAAGLLGALLGCLLGCLLCLCACASQANWQCL